jgi:hypothetical protein
MPICKNPECRKELPEGKNYCNEDCVRKASDLRQKNFEGFKADLRDGAFQRGILWRKNKLLTIQKAKEAGVSDEQILKELRIGGITIQKARELMRDSEELFGR